MSGQTSPPYWSDEQLAADNRRSVAAFREERIQEPVEEYHDTFQRYRAHVENLIEGTVDLSQLADQAVEYLSDPDLLIAIRYLAAPAVSADDLKVVAEAESLAPKRVKADPEMARRIIETILPALDRNRFPWMSEDREPTESERETAIVATAALMASRRVLTDRANRAKNAQERAVADRLIQRGFSRVPTRTVDNLTQAPGLGEFCNESMFGTRKADLIVGLWDGRTMAIECKVSNSSTNSVKRLNNDAAAKAERWIRQFGTQGIVPAAVLAGVFKVHNLRQAQDGGLALFWAHNLDALIEFIEATRP